MEKDARIYVAGHKGLAGSAIVRQLKKSGYTNLVIRGHAKLELTDQVAVRDFFQTEKPEYVFLCAAKVGGILANSTQPAEFIFQNLSIQNNIIHESYQAGVERLMFLGSSCIYPRDCPQPMKEEYMLTGPLEWTNRSYAIAKIAGIEMCWSYNRQYGTKYLAIMPTNLYGPGDNYDLENSHVLPALIRKMHEAKKSHSDSVSVWGTGKPLREFLYCDDLGDAAVLLMNLSKEKYEKISGTLSEDFSIPPLINIGTGKDITINDLALLVKDVIGFEGRLEWDHSKPDGTPQKLLDISRINSLGWKAKTDFRQGIAMEYQQYLDQKES